MGLLEKTNPQATSRSVTMHAVGWGVASVVVFVTARFWVPALHNHWLFGGSMLPRILGSFLFGAFVGGLMEWQLDDGPDNDND